MNNFYKEVSKKVAKASKILYDICKDDLTPFKKDTLTEKEFETLLGFATKLSTLSDEFHSKHCQTILESEDEIEDEAENV